MTTNRKLISLFALLALLSLSGSKMVFAYGYRIVGENASIVEVSSTESSAEPVIWQQNEVSFNLQFDGEDAPAITSLLNETSDWNSNARAAMSEWNAVGADFTWTEGSAQVAICTDDPNNPDEVNSTGWSETYCGVPWGTDVLAVTEVTYMLTSSSDGTTAYIADTNIIVNSSVNWDAYDGSVLLVGDDEQLIFDFRRVFLHELGHALGLIHPDDVGQEVTAIMNSREDGTYQLASDDSNGIRALYPSSDGESESSQQSSDAGSGINNEDSEAGTENTSTSIAVPNISRSGGGGSMNWLILVLLGIVWRGDWRRWLRLPRGVNKYVSNFRFPIAVKEK